MRTKLLLSLLIAVGVLTASRSEAQSSCQTQCSQRSSCNDVCYDADSDTVRTCGDVIWYCTPDCSNACGGSTNCSQNCYDNSQNYTNCQGYGDCDPATCQATWVEDSRDPVFNYYVKNFGIYKELWTDQVIHEHDIACNQGSRERCDTALRDRCFGAVDCCAAPTCLPGYSLCQ
jgi:hypothetical protein